MKAEDVRDPLRHVAELAGFAVIYVALVCSRFRRRTFKPTRLPCGCRRAMRSAFCLRGVLHIGPRARGLARSQYHRQYVGHGRHEVLPSLAPAFLVALVTPQGACGCVSDQHVCQWAAFFLRLRSLFRFLIVTVPVAPLLSAVVGVTASALWGMQAQGSLLDVLLTWYVANAAGALVFTGLAVLLITSSERSGKGVTPLRAIEAVALSVALVLGTQAVCGVFISEWMVGCRALHAHSARDLGVVPLWSYGGLLAVAFITLVASFGTMKGFVPLPRAHAVASARLSTDLSRHARDRGAHGECSGCGGGGCALGARA